MADYTDYSDDDLATRLKSGDAKAFDEIFGRYSRVMYVYAKNLVRDKDEAEELVQDIFTSLWDKAEKLELKSSLASYLYSAVSYKFINLAAHKRYVLTMRKHSKN